MSIYRARLRNTSNALTLRMSSEQIRLRVSSKLLVINSWIPQMSNGMAIRSSLPSRLDNL